MSDPLSPPWEACKVCDGDHWTKDHHAHLTARVLDLAERNLRWARWAKALGYPFDFTNSEAVPEPWMLDAIAFEWFRDPSGGFPSEAEARFSVYEEVCGVDKALDLLGDPPREVES